MDKRLYIQIKKRIWTACWKANGITIIISCMHNTAVTGVHAHYKSIIIALSAQKLNIVSLGSPPEYSAYFKLQYQYVACTLLFLDNHNSCTCCPFYLTAMSTVSPLGTVWRQECSTPDYFRTVLTFVNQSFAAVRDTFSFWIWIIKTPQEYFSLMCL